MSHADHTRIARGTPETLADQLVQAATWEQQEAQTERDHLAYREKAKEAQGKVHPDNMTPEQRERAAAARARQAQRERELETETNGSAGGWHGPVHVWGHMMPQQQQQSAEPSSARVQTHADSGAATRSSN